MKMQTPPVLRISDKTRTATKADGTKIPVVDANVAFIVRVNQNHIDEAIPYDPARCMYCLACMEQYKSELVWVTRTRAYVELANPAGVSQLVRCVLSPFIVSQLRTFDMNLKHLIVPHTVSFNPPRRSQRLDYVFVTKFKSNQTLAAKRKQTARERKIAKLRAQLSDETVQDPKLVAIHKNLLDEQLREQAFERSHVEPREELIRKEAQKYYPPLDLSTEIPLPKYLQSDSEPAPTFESVLSKPKRKKQHSIPNLRPGGRGDYNFYHRKQP